MVLLCHFEHVRGDLLNAHVLAQIVVIDVGDHVDEVNDSPEGILFANGELDRDGVRIEPVLHHIHNTEKVCAHYVHLIDIGNAGNRVFRSLSPNGFRLRLNAALGAENSYGAVKHAQRALHLNGEVHVTGGINYIDAMRIRLYLCGIIMKVGMSPEACRSGRGYGNASFLLLLHPVHSGCALVSLTELMRFTRVEQDTLCCCRFTGVNVRHYADISDPFERIFSWHGISSLLTFTWLLLLSFVVLL